MIVLKKLTNMQKDRPQQEKNRTSVEGADELAHPFDVEMMREALQLAKLAASEGEIPVGAVLVHNNAIIARGYNQSITHLDPSAHAEMLAVRNGAKALGNYRLQDCTLYVTLEPCSMCAGLLVHARIKRLVFGAADLKTGACGSISNIVRDERLNHQIDVTAGILEEDCSAILSEFFKLRRAKKKALKKGS
jgi:tRNA(adenine34) deaminase